jgi:Cu2+-exporting ATPase/Cu+-exporting ATPase
VFDQSIKKGGMLSDEKKDFVVQQKQNHTVLFVGDGFNDAEAMAAADVSIAAAWGTDFTAETADVIWLQRDLAAIADTIILCRRATSIIRSNLLLAVGYNTIGISLAATGWLHPIAAAVLMLASSLTVTLRASNVKGTTSGVSRGRATIGLRNGDLIS